jgi:DNA-binding response OmpR family regulator
MAEKTVLLIDDDPIILDALRTILEQNSYRVLTAHDGAAGLKAAECDAPDVAIVDMMMPKQSGFLVIEKLKPPGATTPKIIMITANEGSRHRAYAEMLGADDYLRKPFSMELFLEAVTRLCPLEAP